MRLRPDDLCEFSKEDAQIVEDYMNRNRIHTIKQFALFCDVPYQTVQTCLKVAFDGNGARMLKDSYNKIKRQINREICADLVEDDLIKFKRQAYYEFFKSKDDENTERSEIIKEVLEWVDTYMGKTTFKEIEL